MTPSHQPFPSRPDSNPLPAKLARKILLVCFVRLPPAGKLVNLLRKAGIDQHHSNNECSSRTMVSASREPVRGSLQSWPARS